MTPMVVHCDRRTFFKSAALINFYHIDEEDRERERERERELSRWMLFYYLTVDGVCLMGDDCWTCASNGLKANTLPRRFYGRVQLMVQTTQTHSHFPKGREKLKW